LQLYQEDRNSWKIISQLSEEEENYIRQLIGMGKQLKSAHKEGSPGRFV